MNKFKKLLFYFGLFFVLTLKTEDSLVSQLKDLEENIKSLEIIITDVAKNLTAQKRLFILLQKQFESNLAIDNENDDSEEDEEIEIAQIKPEDDDHRLTLRIPKTLMAKIDKKRKLRIGRISRNLWIIETLERATRK